MSKRMLVLMCSIFLVVPLMFYGCGSDGSDGGTGATGATGATGTTGTTGKDLTATAQPESCSVCHGGAGNEHQAFYDQLYQDNVLRVTNLAYAFSGNNDVVTFTMTKAGVNFDCRDADSLNIYFAPYDNIASKFQFSPSSARLSIKATTLAYDGSGGCTSTKASFDNVSLLTKNGFVVVYGRDETIGTIPGSRVAQNRFPFAALLKTGTVDYVSAANVAGCEKCHTVPFLKHGYIYGQVDHVAATDFITCKACHLDNGAGGHFIWQMLVDNEPRAAEVWDQAKKSASTSDGAEDFMTTAEKTLYAYKTRLMNDVHMSHAMEFEYPQSMANCATCHEGKLGNILTDAKFVAETCKSCHAVTGGASSNKPQPSLIEIWADKGVEWHNASMTCNSASCHVAGTGIKTFNQIHTGFDKQIYADAAGNKYSAAITVTIDNASFASNQLAFGFHAAGTAGGLSSANIVPTVLVGLYGYDSKDFIIGPHESYSSTYPDNALKSRRYLEFNTSPRATNQSPYITVTKTGSAWNVTANLSAWDNLISSKVVKRVEIGVMPRLEDPALPKSPSGDNVVALNAPSRTYDIVGKKFVDGFYPKIVKEVGGCNNCHDALATTFHTADRGGNVVICRLCHITKNGGGHLEMQSRSIDSYVHAIHSFQAFDFGSIKFDNLVQSMRYDLKIEAHYPTFGNTNCVSCHNANMFNVPDQSKSMPGVFSASASNATWNRNIGNVPMYIAGPASRACGACHRAEMIKEDQAAELASFNSHTRTNGYLLETTSATATADVMAAINKIMPMFSDGIIAVLPAP